MKMLAYAFWHWPRSGVPRDSYENALMAFHRSLASDPTEGFLNSASFRVDVVPWLETTEQVYEDWYLLRDSSALDPLNEAAVLGPRKAPHDCVASGASGGAGGLYRLRHGGFDIYATRYSVWLSKPEGFGYDEWFEQLLTWVGNEVLGIWQRQMVLGPAPEFCLQATEVPRLPPGLGEVTVSHVIIQHDMSL